MSFLVFLENYNCVQETGQGKVPTVGISLPFLFRGNARKIHESLIIVGEVRLDTPLFGDVRPAVNRQPGYRRENS